MKTRHSLLVAAALLGGCATAPTGSAPAPAGTMLAYSAAAPANVSYTFADSSGFNIKGGAIGDIRASRHTTGTADVSYAPTGPNVEMRIKLTDLSGAFVNSAMGGATNATEADVQGEAVLTITPQGELTIGQLPTASAAAQAVGVGPSFFRRFVMPVPGAPVRLGASWADTVSASDTTGGVRASVRDLVTSTWARDTVLNARTLHVITHATQRTLDVAGKNEGVEIVQKLSGTATGYTLWDAQRNIVVERFETTDLSGTFDLPAMGITGLPVTAAGSGRITLR